MEMTKPEWNNVSPELRAAKWIGAATCVLLVVIVAAAEGGVIRSSFGQAFSILLILAGAFWAARGSERLWRLGEFYLWLTFILSLYHLHVLAQALAGRMGVDVIVVFRPIAVIHLLVVVVALRALGAWSSAEAGISYPARLAAGLFIVGAVVFWVGARTFPGTALEKVQANLAGHFWTSAGFLIANVITLAGLILFTLALREAGERYFSALGLVFFTFGAVFWTLHLAYRLSVLTRAAQEWNSTAGPPQWFEPWRDWAALLFGIYSVLAYTGLAAYGVALLKAGWLPRWVGWTCVVAGLIAAPLGGLPLFIHVPLWLVGILTLRQSRSPQSA